MALQITIMNTDSKLNTHVIVNNRLYVELKKDGDICKLTLQDGQEFRIEQFEKTTSPTTCGTQYANHPNHE